MDQPLTYEQLYAKLKEFGFTQTSPIELNGRKGEAFEHETLENALIVLPIREPSDPVEPFYLHSVLAKLKSRGLIQETNPLC